VPRLILLLAIAFSIFLVYRRVQALPASKRKAEYLKVGLVLLLGVVVLLTLTGRMHWIGAALTAIAVGASRMLPLLLRLFPAMQWLHRQSSGTTTNSGPGQQSTVETSLLRMVLDHGSGEMQGEVLSGDFAGRQLDALDQPDLEKLLDWCRGADVDSARLLESYLARRFGAGENYQQTPPADSGGNMNRGEALAVLGLEDGVEEKDIISAHRSLMQKLHPDRGGNDYLAAKLNQAKDCLLS
jgi:hypothetical protein